MPPTPIIGTNTIHPNNEKETVPAPKYSQAMETYRQFKRMRLIAARDARDGVKDEYDGMSFLKYIDVLKKHDDQYIAPRKNKIDTSINLGTIRDKDTTLVEYAQKFDFEPVAQCYDEDDDMLVEVAQTSEDLVRKSLLLENDREKQKLVARSMVAFGTAYVEEAWVERWAHDKSIPTNFTIGSDTAKWVDKLAKVYEGCQSKLWDIRKCYPGDIRKFFMNGPQGQPFFFTVEYESYDVTKGVYGAFDMFKHVPTYVTFTDEVTNTGVWSSGWTLRPISQNSCEIIRYYDPIANEFGISINGIEMLPIMETVTKVDGIEKTMISAFPLTAISPSGYIPFAKYDLEPMHDFFLSKSQPGKMRVLADVENMLMKLNLNMVKQKARPTMGNKSGRNFGPEVIEPTEIINDIRDGDLFPILPNYQGLMPADFSFFELVQKQLSKNSVEDSFQGINSDPNNKTATQDMNEMKASSLKVAALLDGLVSGRTQLFYLRNYNIMRNWTKPIDKQIDVVKKVVEDKYRTVSVDTQVDGGQKATKKIIFTKDTPKRPKGKATLEDSQSRHQDEMNYAKDGKGEIRIVWLHPEIYATVKLYWFWSCIPVPNGNDPLSYMVFAKQITDAAAFFGPDSLNVKKLKHKFSAMTGNDFDTWFLGEQELQQKQQAQIQAAQGQGGAGDFTNSSGTAPGKSTKSQLSQHGVAPTIGGAMVGKMPQVM